MRGKIVLTLATLLLLVGFSSAAISSPTVIKDNRISDLGATPALGRGYSIATNTFQSLCMQGMKRTVASFDFTYLFEDIDTSKISSSNVSVGIGGQAAKDWLSASVSAKTTVSGSESLTNHHILARMTVDSYYSSVDEAETKLADAAVSMLNTRDILGFFQSCGPFYVRSIGRRATFLVIFTYSTAKNERSLDFESHLKLTLKKFGSDPASSQTNIDATAKFSQASTENRLTIQAKAIGLGASKDASLIATDITSFKTVIQNAFKATQDDVTGRVTSMELVPWVENVQFQSLIKLEETALLDGTKVKRYKQKLNMNENAEFYMQVVRVQRGMLDTYRKAQLCKQYIDSAYKNKGKFRKMYRKKRVINQKSKLEKPIKLEALSKYLNSNVKKLYKTSVDFSKQTEGCLDKIMDAGISRQSFRQFTAAATSGGGTGDKQCDGIENLLAYTPDEYIDAHCMPLLTDGLKPGEDVKKKETP